MRCLVFLIVVLKVLSVIPIGRRVGGRCAFHYPVVVMKVKSCLYLSPSPWWRMGEWR
jgi:hypothetical protein